jgi:hypothetical protein
MIAGAFVLGILLLQVGYVRAQTPDEACAADSLYLISPEMLDLRLETTGRRGLTISWPNLDLNQATCYSLKNTEDLGFDVTVTGGFGDRVDRVFRFDSPDSGDIGAIQPDNIIVTWRNEGPGTYGNIGGKLNLSNNGGIWRYSNSGGWTQLNDQLPMYWLQVNTVALAAGSSNFMIAGFSRGVTAESNPVGLFTYDGADWTRIATEIFNEARLITDIAISPQSNDVFAVGTARDGLFITTDGGQTFTQWTVAFDPDYPDIPPNFRIDVVEWSQNRVFAAVNNFGLFISQDNGVSFGRSDFMVPETRDSETPDYILPVINALSFHPTDPDRVAASLNYHGAYESWDGGVTWQDLYGDLVVSDPDVTGMWVNTGLDLVYDDVSDQTMILGVKQKGLYRTTDGALTWVLVADSIQPANRGKILKLTMTRQPGSPGTIFVLEDDYSLLRSTDSGLSWEHFASQPVINTGYFLLADAGGGGDLTMGSWGGGVYIAGTSISLTDAYTTITSPELRSMDLGLEVTFSDGPYERLDSFNLVCQTFQGWAVWRGPSHNPGQMTLLGLYDRVNPEDCFEGYCGDMNIVIVPNCFAAKRAACFNLENPDTIRFFDEEIYNGFTYNYSVTSFDYGNTALTTAENNTNDMLFSPRFKDDPLSIYPGDDDEIYYNQQLIQINEPISFGEEGMQEIYVFPNPVRMGAGFPRDEGGTVTFKNIPEGSKVLIFTTAGDRVIDIGPEVILGGNMEWNTCNDSGEQIVSGVYLYKVEILQQDDYWGRLVVIR